MEKFSELLSNIDIFVKIAELDYVKVFGPYRRKSDGREMVIVVDSQGNRRTTTYAKFLMEQHLGRQLHPDLETVDHLDGNLDNNDISNFRLVPRDQHSADDTRRVKNVKFNCSMCQKEFERSPRLVRDKSKKGATGIFCSRQCAGKYNRQVQLGLLDKLPVQPYIESEYYKRKFQNESEKQANFKEYIFSKYNYIPR